MSRKADTENYGIDICSDEIDLKGNKVSANDFRAVLAFLGHNYNNEDIKRLLVSSGVPIDKTDTYSSLVVRARGRDRKCSCQRILLGVGASLFSAHKIFMSCYCIRMVEYRKRGFWEVHLNA